VSRFALVLLIACGQPQKAVEPKPEPVRPDAAPVERAAREDFVVGPSPVSVAVRGGALYWTDGLGAIWTMPATGGTPRQLPAPDFAFKIVRAGDALVASTRKDFLRVGDSVEKMNLRLPELPEEVVADAGHVYFTMFKKPQIMRVPVGGGTAEPIGELARGVLAIHGDTVYATSYATGALVALPKAGGKARTIATGLVRPTALAADDTHAYVYSEKDRTVTAIDLATGKPNVIARDLVNSDELVSDGEWLYTRSWNQRNRGALVRIAKRGTAKTIGEDLAAPYGIAFDDEAIYVTARDGAQIVRFRKSAIVD
jgi:hypothetical protein